MSLGGPPREPAGAATSASRFRGPLLVALAAALVFAPALDAPFSSWDDAAYVTQSARTTTPGLPGLLAIWSAEDAWAGRLIEFFPLRDSVYWFLYQAFGANPVPFHLAGILGHVVCSLLVLRLGQKLTGRGDVATAAALLFAVHPIHAESVVWIAALKDPLYTALLLGACLSFLRYRERREPSRFALFHLLLVGSLLCKSLSLGAPLAMLAFDRLLPDRPSWRESLWRTTPALVVSGLFAVQFVLIGRMANVIQGPHGGDWGSHAVLSVWAYLRYWQQSLAPTSFALHHCFWPPTPWDPRLFAGLAAIGLTLGGLAIAWRRWALEAALVCWFLVMLLPVLNVVPFPALLADRYLYAPTVGSCLLIALITFRLSATLRRAVLGGVIVTFAALSLTRGFAWRDEGGLWREVTSDPACRGDTQLSTVLVFFQDAIHRSTVEESLALMEAGFAHPAFEKLPRRRRCATFSMASEKAREGKLGGPSAGYAERAVALCPEEPRGWSALLFASAGRNASRAVEAATRLQRIAPSSMNRYHLGQAKLAARDASGEEDLAEAVRAEPDRICPYLLRYVDAGRAKSEGLTDLAQRCRTPR